MESIKNIAFVCEKHASKPQEKFAKRDPKTFIGKFVKKSFNTNQPKGKPQVEHMWVMVTDVNKDGSLRGKLNNDPIFCDHLKCDQMVDVLLSEIEQELD